MAFNLDFSHVPSGLTIPTLPTTPTGISDVSKSLVDKITTDPGSLFSNPMVGAVNVLGDSVTRLETKMTGLSTGVEFSPSITQAEASAYLSTDPFEDVRTSMGNFMMHTDRLAGLLKSQGIQAPGLQQIMSIGTQMQNMATLLNAASGCLPVIGGATGLFSQDAFNRHAATVDGVLSRIERGAATVADITSTLVDVANLIRGIADKDSQFLQNCVNQLQAASVGLILEALDKNPCAHFVLDTIKNTNPGGVLDVLSKPIVKQ
jgi:hypothetical protein